jgi:predicted RNase H-like nuclease (RuvC/YqgF family)
LCPPQVFLASAEQADNWITNKQAVAIDNESKDSLDTVQSLLKTQVNFEKSIAAYKDNIKSLEHSAESLIKKKHYDADIIKRRLDEVLEKWAKLKRLAAAKSEQLGESKLLFQFLRDAKEVMNTFYQIFIVVIEVNVYVLSEARFSLSILVCVGVSFCVGAKFHP